MRRADRPKKRILRSHFSPGDILMLTAAVRDLHHCYPGRFLTDVDTSCPDLWANNPYLSRLDQADREVEVVDCDYPLIRHSDAQPWHFLHAYSEFLNERWALQIRPQHFKADVHLATAERQAPSPITRIVGRPVPYWILVAGGKFDATIKWWDRRRFQQVVDAFRGRILFVQMGSRGHFHPHLEGVLDQRGQTNLRQMVGWMHHAAGVLCPVTFAMHLCAAVETPAGQPTQRPCVVIAGGREPVHWEAYPGHQFLHTIGALPCCESGGCWRSRVVPLGDGDRRDRPEELCVDVVNRLPHCMDLISVERVVAAIEIYLEHSSRATLSRTDFAAAQPHLQSDPYHALLRPPSRRNGAASAWPSSRPAQVLYSRRTNSTQSHG